MIENKQGHPGEFLDMSTKAAISNTTNNKQVDYKGGSYGTGSRIQLAYTRAMITAALNGSLNESSFVAII